MENIAYTVNDASHGIAAMLDLCNRKGLDMVAELIGKKAALRKAIRAENEQCRKELEQDLRDCLDGMAKNEMMFNLEVEDALVEARIYERQALQCRYRYLLEKARLIGLRVRGGY